VPKSKSNEGKNTSAMMGAVCSHLGEAFRKVASNRGAPGPDRQSVDEVREHLGEVLAEMAVALKSGTYEPGDIRRVWIPKAGGGQRGLGIPNVVDRVVQEAVRMVLEPLYEPTFHASSHGFRPGRSCHTAIAEAKRHLEEGYEWVVDLDLEKFFGAPGQARRFQRVKFPPRQGEEPLHRESSLGLMEATT
jgi:retron-type reverse transcriptase